MNALRIGTRGSALALWQARTVGGLLEAAGHSVSIVTITTRGDRLQDVPAGAAAAASTKAVFVKEIEDALIGDEIDIAVHSAKDMPAVLPAALEIAAVLPREDPRDALVLPGAGAGRAPGDDLGRVLAELGDTPAIGTSSVRRAAQLAVLLPGARFLPIRGNVDTRLRKLDEGQFDGLVLAAAGMIRLGVGSRISAALPIDRSVPAPGQGIVALEIRASDSRARAAAERISDPAAATSLAAERAVVAALGGGCQLPLGVIALHVDGQLEVHAVVTAPGGGHSVRRCARGSAGDAEQLGARLGRELADGGGLAILDEVRRSQ